jgi:hypothetical protein
MMGPEFLRARKPWGPENRGGQKTEGAREPWGPENRGGQRTVGQRGWDFLWQPFMGPELTCPERPVGLRTHQR